MAGGAEACDSLEMMRMKKAAFERAGEFWIINHNNLLDSDRRQIFNETVDLVFRQYNSCWMPHLQERYVKALKMAYVMTCQVWEDEREAFEMRLTRDIDNLYSVAMVLSLGDNQIFTDVAKLIKSRGEKEHLVMYIRAQQIHQMRLYEHLKEWIKGIRIEEERHNL
jgi:hypothetical protein